MKWAQRLSLPCWVKGVPHLECAPASYLPTILSPSAPPARILGLSSMPPASFGTSFQLLATSPPHYPWNSVLSPLIWTPAPASSPARFLPSSCEPFHTPNTHSAAVTPTSSPLRALRHPGPTSGSSLHRALLRHQPHLSLSLTALTMPSDPAPCSWLTPSLRHRTSSKKPALIVHLLLGQGWMPPGAPVAPLPLPPWAPPHFPEPHSHPALLVLGSLWPRASAGLDSAFSLQPLRDTLWF